MTLPSCWALNHCDQVMTLTSAELSRGLSKLSGVSTCGPGLPLQAHTRYGSPTRITQAQSRKGKYPLLLLHSKAWLTYIHNCAARLDAFALRRSAIRQHHSTVHISYPSLVAGGPHTIYIHVRTRVLHVAEVIVTSLDSGFYGCCKPIHACRSQVHDLA